MIEIELHGKKYPGLYALIDDEDYEIVANYTWSPAKRKLKFYAWSNKDALLMHRLIRPTTKHVDHINGNGLDNRRSNLREATPGENLRNRGKTQANTSGYKGVWRDRDKWRAELWKDYRKVYLGCFDSPENAARVYDVAALRLFGEFARLNFPEHDPIQFSEIPTSAQRNILSREAEMSELRTEVLSA